MSNNSFEHATNLATAAAKIVGLELVLARELSRDIEADFNGKHGATVRVRVPGAIEAGVKPIYDKTTPLDVSTIIEQGVDITLTDHVHSNVVLSEGDLDLDLADYTRQVLLPQSRAIVKHVERATVDALQATPETTSITYDPANPAAAFTAMRRALRTNGVDAQEPLIAAVGASIYADLLDTYDDLESDQAARIRGFKVVESTRLDDTEAIGFVRPAFALVVRAPAVPQGAPFGASVATEEGFALRMIRSYDGSVAADRSLVSAFVAVAPMPLAVDRGSEVELVEHGGAVRFIAE